ncbi:MAG: hypothetical protein ABSA50_04075 [Candidatus Bathyarchaeia archaeon]
MTKRKAKSSRNRKVNPLFLLLLLATAFILVFSTVQIPVSAVQISLSPPNGPIATPVTVSGSAFSALDNSCTITSGTSGLIAPGYGCSITLGSGTVSGTFSVGPGIGPGGYTVTVTGFASGVQKDSASSTFTVLQPTITLTPQSGPTGTVVNVKSGGVKFSVGETGCSITSLPASLTNPPPSACSVSSGTVTGQFQVNGAATPGSYEVDVTGTSSGAIASAIFTVTSGATVISVTPTDGPIHTQVKLQGSGFTSIDTSCQITASLANLIAASPAPTCSMGSGKMTGTFYVGVAVVANTGAVITVTGTPGGDSASVAFTVDGSPVIGFTPPSPAPTGTTVVVGITGGQFSSGDTITTPTCTISASPGGLFSSSACAIGSGGTVLSGTFFVVANVASGSTYTVTVKGTLGDFASATFTVAPPPSGAAIYLNPSDGPVGTAVTVTGTGFPSQDPTCTLTSSALLFSSSPTPTCSISSGKITASFKVATGATPLNNPFTVTVTSSSGAAASQSFIVDPTPILLLTGPTSPGSTVLVSLGNPPAFSSGDSSSCTISSSPGGLFKSSACFLSQGPPQSLAGTFFVVANVATGSTYIITVKGSLGDSGSSASFTVTSTTGPILVVTPSDGPRGAKITVQGTGFLSIDTSCIISSTSAGSTPNIITSQSCSVSTTTGVVSGSFIVLSGADLTGNPYTITVTGSSGDLASFTPFTVDSTPTLAFSVGPPATPGTTVQVSIANPPAQFSSGDTSCSISSLSSGLFASSACRIGSAGTDLTGTFFIVASVPSGSSYTVVVTGNLGDTATGTFSVTVGLSLTLTPSYGSPGDKISIVARGLLVTDTSCSITSNNGANGAPLITSPACSISAGTGTGTFIVGPTATADSTWTVTVTGNPGGDLVPTGFTVVPTITITPTNGVVSTPVSFTGSGFDSSTATACTVSILPVVAFTAPGPGCNFVVPPPNGNGQVTGTFTIAPGAPAGTYVITVTDNSIFAFAASASFTLGTPIAQVTISPNVALPGTTVGVSGFGFNGNDASCTISPIAGVIASAPCNISGGTAGGSVTLSPTAPAGTYLITVTGNLGDFASNYLVVILLTGTLTSITTTSTTSITSTTYTTMTTSTSQSLTFTTFTFTGISTAVSYALTTQTFTGESTAAMISTTTSIFTSVQATVTTVATTTSTLGQVIRPVFGSNQTAYDVVGLIAVFMLLGSMVLRRLVF